MLAAYAANKASGNELSESDEKRRSAFTNIRGRKNMYDANPLEMKHPRRAFFRELRKQRKYAFDDAHERFR
jgi:hypothetical protein